MFTIIRTVPNKYANLYYRCILATNGKLNIYPPNIDKTVTIFDVTFPNAEQLIKCNKLWKKEINKNNSTQNKVKNYFGKCLQYIKNIL